MTPAPAPAAEELAAPVIEPTPPTFTTPTPEPQREQTGAPASGGGGVAVIGVYLAPGTLQRVKDAARSEGLTYSDLLVAAFDHVTDEQLRAAFAPALSSGRDTAMPQRVTRRRGAPGIQINLRLSREQREWLDAKVASVEAPSRSALVAETFRIYLSNIWTGAARR